MTGPIDRGTEAAAGDNADLVARSILQLHAFTDRRAAFGFEAHTLALDLCRVVELTEDHARARESAGALAAGAAHLLHAQVSEASTGVVVVSRSWPEAEACLKGRSESRAPRPIGCTFGCASKAFASASHRAAGTLISKPSSPV